MVEYLVESLTEAQEISVENLRRILENLPGKKQVLMGLRVDFSSIKKQVQEIIPSFEPENIHAEAYPQSGIICKGLSNSAILDIYEFYQQEKQRIKEELAELDKKINGKRFRKKYRTEAEIFNEISERSDKLRDEQTKRKRVWINEIFWNGKVKGETLQVRVTPIKVDVRYSEPKPDRVDILRKIVSDLDIDYELISRTTR